MVTLQFVPYKEIVPLESEERIQRLLDYVKANSIVLLEGRLRKEEETSLIEKTMESISKKFKGIELAVISPTNENAALLSKIKANLINMLLGDRQGMTIIGPATIVKEIKQDPDKIELLLNEKKKR